jgi:hypothetical protein
MKREGIIVIASLLASPALADRSIDVALSLGTMIGSEEGCGLAFDQKAIEAYIEKNVASDDMAFAANLNVFVNGIQRKIGQMTASQKTAHCAQVTRVAKANGFVK